MIKVFYRETKEIEERKFEVVHVGEEVVEEIRGEIKRWEKCMGEKGKMGIWDMGYLPRK